jgi:hypothetical protein
MVAWALLHAGTLWLNAAVDQDEGPVLLGESVPVPPGIDRWGYLALAAALVLAAVADPLAGLCCAGCVGLSVAYSHPATLWKGHPVLGPMVNLVGYGWLSPLAGFSVVDVPPNPRSFLAWLLGGLGLLGCYFAAQAFQRDEDAARGYRTLVVTHGPRAAVLAGRVCVGLGFLGAVALSAAGWFPRVCLLGLPLGFVVDRWFARWMAEPDGGGERWARGLAHRLFASGLVVIALCLYDYVDAARHGQPVAGLATAAGRPADRPLLPPALMRRWEAARVRNGATVPVLQAANTQSP